MLKYWKVWLSAHPTRSEAWLKERISEGFEIHHLDRSKGDVASNLVLIEGLDHKMIHRVGDGGLQTLSNRKLGPTPQTIKSGQQIYEMRVIGHSWDFIKEALGLTWHEVHYRPKAYAVAAGRAWPIGGPKIRGPVIDAALAELQDQADKLEAMR